MSLKLSVCVAADTCGHTSVSSLVFTHDYLDAERFPRGPDGKEPACQSWRPGFDPLVGKIPWRRVWKPTPVFLPGESHGQRILEGHSPQDPKESDTTDQLTDILMLRDKPFISPGYPGNTDRRTHSLSTVVSLSQDRSGFAAVTATSRCISGLGTKGLLLDIVRTGQVFSWVVVVQEITAAPILLSVSSQHTAPRVPVEGKREWTVPQGALARPGSG